MFNFKKNHSKLWWILLIVIIYAFFVEPFWLNIHQIRITNSNIPTAFNDKKIVFITDIHAGKFYSISHVKDMVEKANSLKPDIILLGGDYIDNDPAYIEPVFEELSKLDAPLGKYGVLGNHDRSRKDPAIKKQIFENMKKAEIISLENEAVWLEIDSQKIRLGGISDYMIDYKTININPTISDVSQNDFVILLSHNPDYSETISHSEDLKSKIDLVVSGHNHGGQINFFGLWAPIVPSDFGQKYLSGVVKTPFGQTIISNGIGMTIFPARFFARPEIVLINLSN